MYLDVFDRNPFGTNCWLLAADDSDDAVVVDPGFEPLEVRSLLERAGKRPGWLEAAQHEVAVAGFNVNRRGAVFVPVVEGRDLDDLCARLGATSRRVYLAVLDLG